MAPADVITIIMFSIIPFISIAIIILSWCIFCILCYHYKTEDSYLGQKLQRIFTRNSTRQKSNYDHDDTSTTETTERDKNCHLQTHNYQDEQAREVINNRPGSIGTVSTTDVRMQENTAYQSNTDFVVSSNPAYSTSVSIALELAGYSGMHGTFMEERNMQ